MYNNKKIKELTDKVTKLEHQNKYKKCPLCYGAGEIEGPSKEGLFINCNNCVGTGEVRR